MTKIDKFEGVYRFLSNFTPCQVTWEGELYPSVEHAYQSAKTTDGVWRKKIQAAPTAAAAKKMGKRVPLRSDWNNVRIGIMETLLREKFTWDEDLCKALLATGEDELIEGNWWGDTFWGICRGEGENVLGKLLMKIRQEFHDTY